MGLTAQAFDHIDNKTDITELSAVLYADSFFCGFWSANGELLKCSAHNKDEFNDLLDVWSKDYSLESIQLVTTGIPFLHMPQEHFDGEYFEHYFKGIYDVRKCYDRSREMDALSQLPIQTLYYIDSQIIKKLSGNEIPFKVGHISSSLVNYAILNNHELIVYLQGKTLHICCCKEGKFVYYNQFYCTDTNDYLYFILMIMQVFDYSQSTQVVLAGGELDTISPLYGKLKIYIPYLSVLDDVVVMPENIDNSGQLYFDLFLARTCV